MFRGCRGKVKKNVSANQRPGRHLCWPIGPRNTNVVQSVEYLIHVKFARILFSAEAQTSDISRKARHSFAHTQNAGCVIFLARKTTTLLYTKVWKINVLFYEAARLYPALKSSRKTDSVLQSRSIRVQGGHLCFQIGPTKKKPQKQKCVTGHLHFVVLAFFHGQRVITIVHWKKRLSQNPSGQILDREKRRIERSYFIRRKGYFIMDLRGYRLFYCTVGRIVTWHIEIYIW